MTDKPDTARPVAIAQDANVSKQEALDQWQQEIAYTEAVYNGAVIRWRYWVEQMPQLRAAEAARLMRALDPDLFQSLDHRPNKKDPSKRCEQAAVIQRLAERQGMQVATPAQWLAWALREGFVVHDGFRLAVESQPAPAQDTAPTAPVPETKEHRQDRFLKLCEDEGLPMPNSYPNSYLRRLPAGVGRLAEGLGMTRQTFSNDLRAALKRREAANKEGVIRHKA